MSNIKDNLIIKQLKYEKLNKISGGLYQRTLVKFLDTRHDFLEVANMSNCFSYIIDTIDQDLNKDIILMIRYILKKNTKYTKLGDVGFKTFANYLGPQSNKYFCWIKTIDHKDVDREMNNLLNWYSNLSNKKLEDIVQFLVFYILIHPFQDGNGRVSRLLIFRECLRNNIVPVIIEDGQHDEYLSVSDLWFWFNNSKPLLDFCYKCQKKYEEFIESLGLKL